MFINNNTLKYFSTSPQNGGRYCLGERKRYRICNVDACLEGETTFREQQCAEFNDIPYRGGKLEWESVQKSDPCKHY